MTHDFTPQIKAYYKAISAGSAASLNLNLNRADHTEASYRPALQNERGWLLCATTLAVLVFGTG